MIRSADLAGGAPERAGAGIVYPIQVLRALAAFAVALAHTLLETDAFPGHAAFYALGKTGPLPAGVDLFFLISGFIMLYTSRPAFAQPHAPYRFLVRRLIRIVPLYWMFTGLMIVATLLFPDRLNKTVFDVSWAIRSLLFIPTIGPDGDVGPILALGWSLEYEMYFYVLFAVALTHRETSGLAILATLLAGIWALASLSPPAEIGLVKFLGNPVIFEFLLGVAFARSWLDVQGRRRWVMYAAWLVGTASAYVLLEPLVDHRVVDWGLPCLFLLVAVMGAADVFGSGWCRPLRLLGDASYALYLSHPFTLELLKWGMIKIVPSTEAWIYVVCGLVVAHLGAIVIYETFERPLLTFFRASLLDGRRPGRPATAPAVTVAPGSAAFEARDRALELR